MSQNLFIIFIVIIIAICLIVFLFVKNQKDRKEFENQMNKDYPHKPDSEGDIETEDPNKV